MRRLVSVFVALVAIMVTLPSSSFAQQMIGTPKVKVGVGAEWPMGQSTTLSGKMPEEAFGTWLVVENLEISKSGDALPNLRVYRIKRGANGQAEGEVLSYSIPVEVQKQIDDAQSMGRRWEPSEKDLPAILDAVRRTASPDGKLKVKHYLDVKGSFPEATERYEKRLSELHPDRKPTLFAIRFAAKTPSDELYSGNYYIQEIQPNLLQGSSQSTTVPRNAAGIPIPLNFVGTAKLIRVDQPAAAAATTPVANAKPTS